MSISSLSFSAGDDDQAENKPRSKRRIQKKPRHKGPEREDSVIRSRPPRRDFEDNDYTFDDEDKDLDPDWEDDDEFENLDEDIDFEDDDFQ
jgi:hypothetical protein